MSGKPKIGFDWAKWDTHFDDDPKIDKLLDAQGGTGFYIYFWLCQKASANGYYYQWSYANAATTARKMAGRIRSETVRATVGTCCQVGLFDKRLLECEGILTSKRIQRNYVDGVSKGNRSFRRVEQRFWLLDEAETAAGKITFFESEIPDVGESYAENTDVLIENADVLIEHGPKKRIEQNRSINKNNTRPREEAWRQLIPTLDEVKAYALEIQSRADPVSFYNYYAAAGWHDRNGDPVRNWRQKFAVWNSTGNGCAPGRGNGKKSLTFYDVAERNKRK